MMKQGSRHIVWIARHDGATCLIVSGETLLNVQARPTSLRVNSPSGHTKSVAIPQNVFRFIEE